MYTYIHIYIYSLTFKDVNCSSFTFKGGVTPKFADGLLPPYSRIQFHVPRKTWHAWQVYFSKPSSCSKTFSYNGDTNCEESRSQLKCALEWLWFQHCAYNKLPGVNLKNISLVVLSLDFQFFLTYIYIQFHQKNYPYTNIYIYRYKKEIHIYLYMCIYKHKL